MVDALEKLKYRLSLKRYRKYWDEIETRNASALRVYAVLGLFVSLVNILMQMDLKLTRTFLQNVIIFLFFLVICVIDFTVGRGTHRHSTLFLYLSQIPVMLLSILMGTVLDPEKPTITFLMFIVILPAVILDNIIRLEAYIFCLMAAFLVLGYFTKDPAVFTEDVIHVFGFYLGSASLSAFVVAERTDGVEDSVKANYRAEHDEVTGLQNRYALERRRSEYLNRGITVVISDIDNFRVFNDIYGHDVGEEIVREYAEIISGVFGPENCYRYESDEVLVILQGISEEKLLDRLAGARHAFRHIRVRDRDLHPSFSAGYVYGIPEDERDIREMIRHADVRLYEAKNSGTGRTAGYAYDNSQQRQSDILTEVTRTLNRKNADLLTGLPNMQYFRIRADELLASIMDRKREVVFVYFNIGNFKAYNEQYGFAKGDELLRDIANDLQQIFQRKLVSRFGEDHFVVMTYRDEVEEKLYQAEKQIYPRFNKQEMNLKAGIYIYQKADDVGLACDRAKTACDSIKKEYAKIWVYYTRDMEKRNELEQYVISHIDEAVEKGYLRVFYQPIVDTETGRIVEAEALARWVDPVYGFLSPADFIPVLEDAHLIHKVDLFVARQVCEDYEKVVKDRRLPIAVSINLSRHDFMLTDIVKQINDIVHAYGVPNNVIHIEITESALAENYNELKSRVAELKSFGFETWLDDFGSGYSSFNSLMDFDFDVIKVDMRFMRDFGKNKETPIIVSSIAEMAAKLGMRSLVEGVETEEQYQFLRSIHVDMIQGYLVSRPVALSEFTKLRGLEDMVEGVK